MKSFLVIFTCTINGVNHERWKKLDSRAQRQCLRDGEEALKLWTERYGGRVVFEGGSLAERTNVVDASGIQDLPSRAGRFAVVHAESSEEAARMFDGHPHFAIFPGDGIEITEWVEAPRQSL